MPFISWVLSPIGRWAAAIGGFVLAVGTIYLKGRSDAKAKLKAEAVQDAYGRMKDAIRAGDNAAVSPDRLRENDGHRRD